MTTMYPEIAPQLERFSSGVWAAHSGQEYFLVIKASRELILSAEEVRVFNFHLAPVKLGAHRTISLIAAFHSPGGEPLTLRIPLLADSTLSSDFLKTLWQSEFKLFFLDPHNQEIFSCVAACDSSSLSIEVGHAKPVPSEWVEPVLLAAQRWFENRTPLDDAAATQVNILRTLVSNGLSRPERSSDSGDSRNADSNWVTAMERTQISAFD